MSLKSELRQKALRISQARQPIAKAIAERFLAERNARVPIDTGGLLNSIKETPIEGGVRITEGEGLPDARAIYTEFGTSKAAASPHWFPAVEQAAQAAPGVAASILRKELS